MTTEREKIIALARECGLIGYYLKQDEFIEAFYHAAQAEAFEKKAREQKHVYWTHSCNVLCLDNVELWIDRCPHCGKPSPFGVTK